MRVTNLLLLTCLKFFADVSCATQNTSEQQRLRLEEEARQLEQELIEVEIQEKKDRIARARARLAQSRSDSMVYFNKLLCTSHDLGARCCLFAVWTFLKPDLTCTMTSCRSDEAAVTTPAPVPARTPSDMDPGIELNGAVLFWCTVFWVCFLCTHLSLTEVMLHESWFNSLPC